MAPLKILICGGDCAGPALAYWLSQTGHRVVVVERCPALKASGAQIDLRAQGIEVVKRMGLLDIVRSKLVDEAGVSFVDSHGNVMATMMASKSARSLTSEYEIMRGDLVHILYDATKLRVKYLFGKTVQQFEQEDTQIVAHFSDSSSDTFDLLVGADGQGSRIRKAIQSTGSQDPYTPLGLHMAYSPDRRMIMRISHNETETQVYLVLNDDTKELSSIPRASVGQQKEFWAQRFRDAGWETERFLEGLKTTENFYCHEVAQVHADKWYKGRVVLLGDAAYCPSPFSAMGTTGSFIGAYVLAGEINRTAENLTQAFENYEKTLRPFLNEIQKLNPFTLRLAMPETQLGITIIHFIARVLCFLCIRDLISRFSREETSGWQLPDYPELKPHQ